MYKCFFRVFANCLHDFLDSVFILCFFRTEQGAEPRLQQELTVGAICGIQDLGSLESSVTCVIEKLSQRLASRKFFVLDICISRPDMNATRDLHIDWLNREYDLLRDKDGLDPLERIKDNLIS